MATAQRRNRRLLVWIFKADGKAVLVRENNYNASELQSFADGVGIAVGLWPDLYVEDGASRKTSTMDTPRGKLLFFVERAT